MFSRLTQQLIDALKSLSGIGPKSAQRMAFELLTDKGRIRAKHLSKILNEASEKVGSCTRCHTYTEEPLCPLCQNLKRNSHLLCVVETSADIAAIEQASIYNGLYFVLNGHLSPLDGIGPQEIGIPYLLDRLNQEPIQELILATNPTMEGKTTANYITSQIDLNTTKCTRIAHGVPLGGELEYLDSDTLSHAFYSRTEIVK